MNKYCVYKHTSPVGKVYIGITSQKPERRWKNGEGYKNNIYFYQAILKYGWDAFEHEIIHANLTHEEAVEKEVELINKFDSANREKGYNLTFGGECYEFTEDVKERLKQNHSHSWLGRHHSEETKRKISAGNKGKFVSEETKQKIRENHKHLKTFEGKRHTEKSRKKISENHWQAFGKDNPSARSVRCVETGEVFECIKHAAEKYGANRNHICSCCAGRRKTTGGYHWEYVVGEQVVV